MWQDRFDSWEIKKKTKSFFNLFAASVSQNKLQVFYCLRSLNTYHSSSFYKLSNHSFWFFFFQDLKKIIERIEMGKRKSKRKQIVKFKAALTRGISYHHAGLDFKRRSCVEMLFREKYLQVSALSPSALI